jgi:Flp pilus assembly pilin Flp
VAIAVEQGLVVALIALVIIAGVSAFGALVNRALVNRALVNRASVKGRSRVRGLLSFLQTPFERNARSSGDCPAVA